MKMKTNMKKKTTEKAASQKRPRLKTMFMTCLLLCLCLAACSDQSGVLPDEGGYPTSGERVPLQMGAACISAYTDTGADTRGIVELTDYIMFRLYIFTKYNNNYRFTSFGNYYNYGQIQPFNATAFYYKNTTIRIIAISNGRHYDQIQDAEAWLDKQPTAPKWGDVMNISLLNQDNFMIYDSGDIAAPTAPLQIGFRYLTSKISLKISSRSNGPISLTSVDIRPVNFYMTGTWAFGDSDITPGDKIILATPPPSLTEFEGSTVNFFVLPTPSNESAPILFNIIPYTIDYAETNSPYHNKNGMIGALPFALEKAKEYIMNATIP